MNQLPCQCLRPYPLSTLVTALYISFLMGSLFAANSDMSSARAKYPQIVNTKLNSCTLCHTNAPAVNSYGRAYDTAGRNNAAYGAIESQDSDSDGYSNLTEITAGTFPGDATDRPSQATTTTTTTTPSTTTTLPPGLNALIFPQVAAGGGYRSFLIVNNPNAAAVTATAIFRNPNGQPLSLMINGSAGTELNFTLPARGSTQIALSDSGDLVKTGWVQVSASSAVGGALVYQLLDAQELVSQASVLPSAASRRFNILVPQLGGQTLTGLAIANAGQTEASITLQFVGMNGSQIASGTVPLPPGQQLSQFINQYLPGVSASASGVLEVSSSGNIAAVGLVYVIGSTAELFTIPLIPVP
jgi:hypothetical protein